MITVEDIQSCVSEDIILNTKMKQFTKFIKNCRVCGKIFTLTIKDVNEGKKRAWCSDGCAQSNTGLQKLRNAVEAFHKAADLYQFSVLDVFDLERDRELEAGEDLRDPCPDSGYEEYRA